MKFDLKLNQLPIFTLICGGIGVLLRFWHYAAGLDESGLLRSSHPAGILVLILSAAVIGIVLWKCWDFKNPAKYSRQYPTSSAGGVGAFVCAAGILLTSMAELVRRETVLSLLAGLLGIAAAIALAFTGLCRLKGLRPHWGFHTLVCLCFALRLISRYQTWSSDPQLFDYCFQLLATIAAMLFSYHRAALDFKAGKRRRLVIFGLLGGYFCCLSLIAYDAPLLYAGLAAWMLTNLGELDSVRDVPAEEN